MVLFASGAVFYELLLALGIPGAAQRILGLTRQAADVVTSKTMVDAQKETAVRALSLQVATATLAFIAKLGVAIAATGVATWLGCAALDLPLLQFLSFAQGWVPLSAVIVVMLVYARLRRARAG